MLLRVLERREVRRCGSANYETVDVRVIASTRKNLKNCVNEDTFREDLRRRLGIFENVVPPLQERKHDIPLLVEHFLAQCHPSAKLSDLPAETLPMLMASDWPDNVRGLRSAVERMVAAVPVGAPAASAPAVPGPAPLEILKTWVGAVLAAHREGRTTSDRATIDALPALLRRLEQSELFARLSTGDPLRTRPCPVHRGQRGERGCPYFCDGTGWLREPPSPIDGPTPFLVPFPAETSASQADLASVDETLDKERVVAIGPDKRVEPNAIELSTHLAIEYAHRYRDNYPGGVFWVNAAADVRAAFAMHAETLALRFDEMPVGSRYAAKVLAFIDYLVRRPRSLIVFDDVRDPDHLGATLRSLWGETALCCVLVVTSARIFKWPPSTQCTPEPQPTHLQRNEQADVMLRARWDELDDAKARKVVEVAALLDKTVELDRNRLATLAGVPLEDLGTHPGTRGPVLETLCGFGFVEEISPQYLRLPWGLQQHVRSTLEDPGDLAFACARRLQITHLTPSRALEKVVQNQIDDLLTDLRAVRYLFAIAKDTKFAAEIAAWLDLFTWNAVHLRRWDAAAEPSFFFQQSRLAGGFGLPRLRDENAPYLRERFNPSPDGPEHLFTLVGHTRAVTHVAITPDGLRAISASEDRTLRVWDLRTGQSLHVLVGHEERIVALAAMPDGKRARTVSVDGTIHLWDLDTGAILRVDGRPKQSRVTAMTPDGRVVVQADDRGCLSVYATADGIGSNEVREIPIATLVDRVWLSANGRFAAMESHWGCEVMDLARGNLVDTSVPQRTRLVEAVPDIAAHIAMVPSDSDASTLDSVTVWTPRTGFVKRKPRLFLGKAHFRENTRFQDGAGSKRIGTTSDGSRIWFACRSEVEIYDAASFELCDRFDVPWEWVDGIIETSPHVFKAFSFRYSSGKRMAIASVVRFDHVQTPNFLVGHRNEIQGMAFSRDGRLTVTASADGTLKVWDLSRPPRKAKLGSTETTINALAVQGTMAVSAGIDVASRGFEPACTLQVWDLESGKVLHTHRCTFGRIRAVVALSAAPQRLVGVTDDKLMVWAINGLEPERIIDIRRSVASLGLHRGKRDFRGGEVRAVAVTDDGRRAVIGVSRRVAMVDIEAKLVTAALAGHTDIVCAVALTPRGDRTISASYDHTLKVWDGQGTLMHTLTGHTGPVLAVAVTSDGTRVASGSEDGTIRLWDLSRPDKPVTLEGYRAPTRGIAFTPSGRGVVSTSMDGTLLIWRIVDEPSEQGVGHILSARIVHRFVWREPLLGCAVALGGRTIVVLDITGRVHLLDWVGIAADATDAFF